ncbi:MAG: radical SAM protein [Candidatus Woesearchaeota archaeon]
MIFKSLKFSINKTNNALFVSFYGSFYFEVPLEELIKIDHDFKIDPKNSHNIIIKPKAEKKFMFIIDKYMHNLRSKINKTDSKANNKAIYIHENSGIPLFGLQFIGIIDKGTDMIEIKPLTGCNMNCIFCSVGEGLDTKKEVDFVVEEEYLVNELKALIDFKAKHEDNSNSSLDTKNKFSIWINPHGEPLLYSRILDLIKDIDEIQQVKDIHLITSGTLLNHAVIDQLAKIKKLKMSISISAFDKEKAKQLMGTKAYVLKHVLDMVKYAVSKGIETTITPVYIHGINDDDIERLIRFCKAVNKANQNTNDNNKLNISIQKFCMNKFGRNPIKEQDWDDFGKKMKEWENLYGYELLQTGDIGKTEELPRPFKKGDVVQADIVSSGRFLRDKIAVAKGRCILLPKCTKCTKSINEKCKVKVKITTNKYGMYIGSC